LVYYKFEADLRLVAIWVVNVKNLCKISIVATIVTTSAINSDKTLENGRMLNALVNKAGFHCTQLDSAIFSTDSDSSVCEF